MRISRYHSVQTYPFLRLYDDCWEKFQWFYKKGIFVKQKSSKTTKYLAEYRCPILNLSSVRTETRLQVLIFIISVTGDSWKDYKKLEIESIKS